jgi:hypothetical protein
MDYIHLQDNQQRQQDSNMATFSSSVYAMPQFVPFVSRTTGQITWQSYKAVAEGTAAG